MSSAKPTDLVLGPATRLLWRSSDTLHLELGSRAVVVEGLPARLVHSIVTSATTTPPTAPAGHRGPTARLRALPPAPTPPPPLLDAAARDALDELVAAGFLWLRTDTDVDPAGPHDHDSPGAPDDTDVRLRPPSPRLAGELASLAVRHGDGAAAVLAARRHARVTVHGTSRAAAHLAALLAAAGVGRVHCAAAGSVRLHQLAPGGVGPRDEGHDFVAATDAAIRRAAPEADTTALPVDETPDLTVLATDVPIDETRRAALHAAGAAHLVVALGVDHGVVGPLVVPGSTSCLRCADLHRRDRDPAWSALAAQLTIDRRYGPSSDLAVATTVVGAAATQILTYLDGGNPACVDGTLELRLPDWRLRRRSRSVHVDCGCCGPAPRAV